MLGPQQYDNFTSFIYVHSNSHLIEIPKQRGLVTYSLASNSQRPLAGAMHNAVFNTARRVRGQWLYVAPPFLAAYLLLQWMEEK
jgi:ubiquinol-cytochrome c reductase subunit 8